MKSKPAKRQKQKRKKKRRKRQKRQDSSRTFGHTDILLKDVKGTTPEHLLGFGTARLPKE